MDNLFVNSQLVHSNLSIVSLLLRQPSHVSGEGFSSEARDNGIVSTKQKFNFSTLIFYCIFIVSHSKANALHLAADAARFLPIKYKDLVMVYIVSFTL